MAPSRLGYKSPSTSPPVLLPTLAPLPSGAFPASSTPSAHFIHPHGCQISAQGFKVRAVVEAARWQLDLVEWESQRTDTLCKTPPEAKQGGRRNPWGPSFYPPDSSTASYWPSPARHWLAEDPGRALPGNTEAGEGTSKSRGSDHLPPKTHLLEKSKSPDRLQLQNEGAVKRYSALDASVLKLGKIKQRFWNHGSVPWRRRRSLKLGWKELLYRPPTTRVTDNVLASGYKPQCLGSETRPPQPCTTCQDPGCPEKLVHPPPPNAGKPWAMGECATTAGKMFSQAGQRTMSTIIMLYFLT